MVVTNKIKSLFSINMNTPSDLWDGPCVFDLSPPIPDISSKLLAKEINKLPNDIVRYICLLSVISNEQRWKKNHKRLSQINIFSKLDMKRNAVKYLQVDDIIKHGNEKWYVSARAIDKTPCFFNRTVCSDSDNKFSYDDIETNNFEIVYVMTYGINSFSLNHLAKRKIIHDISNGESTNSFIVNKKCRCFECDTIRCAKFVSENYGQTCQFHSKYSIYKGLHHNRDLPEWSHYPKMELGFVHD